MHLEIEGPNQSHRNRVQSRENTYKKTKRIECSFFFLRVFEFATMCSCNFNKSANLHFTRLFPQIQKNHIETIAEIT